MSFTIDENYSSEYSVYTFHFFESELYCIIKARSFNVCIGITAGLVTDERLDLFNVMNCFWGAVLVDLDQNFPD